MRTYAQGFDTEIFGDEAVTSKALLIRVKNAAALARSQGALASIATGLAPATIEAKVLDEMKKKLQTALAAEHVEADITVVEPNMFQSASGNHIWQDVGFAVASAGFLGWLAYFLLTKGRH